MINSVAPCRDVRIELYRIFLMFGICVLHAASFGIGSFHPLAFAMTFCVDGFAFITGWFGTRFTVGKILLLESTGIYCSILAGFGSGGGYVEIFRDYWFLHAYVLMLFFVDIVNYIMRETDDRVIVRLLLPLLVAIFGWGICTELPVIHRYTPRPYGLGSFSAIALLGVYIIGRLCCRFRISDRISIRVILVIMPVLYFFVTLGYGWLGHYCSPVAVLLAIVVFSAFARMPSITNKMALKTVSFIRPSLFAIYLLQVTPIGKKFISYSIEQLLEVGCQEYFAVFVCACALFVGGIVLDMPRRLSLKVFILIGNWLRSR